MKITIVISVLLAFYLHLTGQNLVPNCDFDLIGSCPNNTGQLDRARDWYRPGEGTSDLCHSCASGNVGTPYNLWGVEEPYSGRGYAHIICYYPLQGNDYREYIQVRLACPLVAEEVYDVSFYVSVTENSKYAIDGIGMLITDSLIVQNGSNVINPGFPGHIFNPPGVVITKKDGWKRISGHYTAEGEEEYITIGSFIPEYDLTIQPFSKQTSYYSSFYIDMVEVRPNAPIQLLENDTTLCFGESVVLNAPDLCSGTFTWEDGSTDSHRLITQPGTYSIMAELGCSVLYDEIIVNWLPEPQLTIPPDTILCRGSSLWLEPGNFHSFLWQDGSTDPGYLVNEAGTYWVEVTSGIGCSYRDTINIEWLETPVVELGEDITLCIGDSLLLDASNENQYTTYLWQDNSSRQYFTVKSGGEYQVMASNPCGSDMDNIYIGYKDCDPVISVPNAFTPNSDGRNDIFRAIGLNIANFRMHVYSRWGELIFTSYNPGIGWDGTKDGEKCQGDVYVWSVYYESNALETTVRETVSGIVVLIR